MNYLEQKIAYTLRDLVILLAAESSDPMGRFEVIMDTVVDELIRDTDHIKSAQSHLRLVRSELPIQE